MGMRVPLLLVACVLAAGCDVQVGEKGFSLDIAEGRARDEWLRTYTLPAGGTVEIVNVNGQIEASETSGPQVEVRAEREVRNHSSEAAGEVLRKLQMREDVSKDRVRIEAQGQSDQGLGGFGRRTQVTITYRIRVPAGVAVSLKTDNGGIRLDNLSGAITASTTNGGINGQGLSGAVEADVVNGGVQLGLAALRGDVHVSTTNGGVRLDLPRDVRAALDATCVNGGIDVDEDFMLQASTSSRRRLAGTINGGGPRISASTVNGGIRIRAGGAQTD